MRSATFLLLVSALGFQSCHTTASGRAIEARLGSTLQKLWRSPLPLIEGGARRMRDLVRNTTEFPFRPQARVAEAYRTVSEGIARTGRRLGRFPAEMVELPSESWQDTMARLGQLSQRDNRLSRAVSPGQLLARLRDKTWWFLERSDLTRPLLPGPGDPDQTTDPNLVGRQETLVERLLRRF